MSRIAANLPVRATKSAASSLSSDCNAAETLYDALVEGHAMHRRKSSALWNCPRKAIRTVDSMSRIEGNLIKPESKSLKSAMENKKYKRKMKNRVKRHINRISELAKPKILPNNNIRGARNDPGKKNSNNKDAVAKKKSCGVLKTKKQLRLSGAPKIADNPLTIRNETRNIASGETLPLQSKGAFVKSSYKISERTKRLAEPRTREEAEIRPPGKIAESALFATASRRLVELARPKSKPRAAGLRAEEEEEEADDDDDGVEKRNAFAVSREALRATCSRRIADLSIPKSRRIRSSKEEKNNRGVKSECRNDEPPSWNKR
ncbi:uncharacterized protein LOC105691498 isoform X2 [Athalia rosae]|uniref:uncharacterized protein LOC105691498 isoform X2 n=1 Tax=Athalia rosae TaxID=37344 RepID=UPI0020336552|nr:uncharacterized protein LOC105691498 isoform X2 [Athalia rosae]